MARANQWIKHQEKMSFKLVAKNRKPITTHAGISLTPDASIEEVEQCDLVYLPALWGNPQPRLKSNRAAFEWLSKLNRAKTIIAGVGTGCCFLAEAGLLDGKPGTTHWHYFDQFSRRYPKVNLQRQYFITVADNIYCTGSTNSLADLTVLFIRNWFGRTIANHVERHFFHEIRQNYLRTASATTQVGMHADETIARVQATINESLDRPISVEELAAKHGMSVRTLNRRFRAATGHTPLQYIQAQRVSMAADLLKTTNLSIAEIAFSIGYNDVAHFNSLFKREFAITPHKYRSTLRAKLFSVDQKLEKYSDIQHD